VRLGIVSLLLLVLSMLSIPATSAAESCTRVAARDGSDRAAGTVAAPFRTAQRVVESLRPGDVGCLRAGTYDEEVNGPFVVNFHRGGTAAAPVTLRSYPGERAKLHGIVVVSHGADHVVITGFDIDARRPSRATNPIGIQLMARATMLEDSNVSSPTASCVSLGVDGWGTAIDNVIRRNVFHDCGTTKDGIHDHAIYANDARGGEIVDNVFLRSAAFAVHFYGTNRRVRVAHNVMYANGGGVIFAGYGAHTSSDNVVEQNVISGSLVRPAAQSWWGGARGTGNVFRSNCVSRWGGREIDATLGGFGSSANVSAAPRFVDAGAGDFRLAPGSDCAAVVGYDTAALLREARLPAALPARRGARLRRR
jgi:hypothetical protein